MKFILSQELSRHNRDKKCSPIEQQISYKTYEISYETIEILPSSYTIITPSETLTAESSGLNTNEPDDPTEPNSEIFLIPPITNESEFGGIQQSTHRERNSTDEVGTVKSWNCGLCTYK